jgi:hypothetical protein
LLMTQFNDNPELRVTLNEWNSQNFEM